MEKIDISIRNLLSVAFGILIDGISIDDFYTTMSFVVGEDIPLSATSISALHRKAVLRLISQYPWLVNLLVFDKENGFQTRSSIDPTKIDEFVERYSRKYGDRFVIKSGFKQD